MPIWYDFGELLFSKIVADKVVTSFHVVRIHMVVSKLRVKPCYTDIDMKKKLGKFVKSHDYRVVRTDTDVVKDDGQILFKYRQRAIEGDFIGLTNILKKAAGPTRNRTIAAGPCSYVNSRPIGNTEQGETAWTRQNKAQWLSLRSMIHVVDQWYKALTPEVWKKQRKAAKASKSAVFDSAFSTITVNHNFRTAVHTDSNNFDDGMAVMILLQGNSRNGGHLLFPRYKLAVTLDPGDVIVYDVKEHHTNSALTGGQRLSCVFYLRQGLVQ
jgi:hypothetical protein